MRAKINGGWLAPFDPAEVNFNYTEANAWQYSFYVPQDVDGLIGLMGGTERFAARLDSLFTVSPKTTGTELPDISGLIGQYAHGNEPSHHMAYLYSFAGQAVEDAGARAEHHGRPLRRRTRRASAATRTAGRCPRGTF